MCRKFFAVIFLLLALLMGVMVSVMPPERLQDLIVVSRFIEVMIPILAVGALIKYLFSCGNKN